MRWSGSIFHKRVIPGAGLQELLSWPIPADPVDEPDGGTFYRPDDTYEWIDLVDGPYASGVFSLPDCILCVGEADEAHNADAYIEFADKDEAPIIEVHAASMTTDGGIAIRTGCTFELELSEDALIAKVRFRIVGGSNLYWSGGGTMVKLR